MKPTLRLAFSDFWTGFDPRDNYFTRLLSQHYEVELCETPDFLVYSCFGAAFRRFNCMRIFFAGENVRPDFDQCDFAFTHDFCGHPNHYRLPFYGLYSDRPAPIKTRVDPRQILAEKSAFCNFVYSNKYCATRNRFFRELSKYKRVDAGGKLFNNIGRPLGRTIDEKLAFIRRYKFTIAFENDSYPGYTTEKIYEPMYVNSLPIYWGNPLVYRDFNPASFLNFHDYANQEAVIDRIIEVDRNDDLYCDYLRQPWFHGNRINQFINPANVLGQFDRIFSSSKIPIARDSSPARFFRVDRAARRTVNYCKRKLVRTSRKARYHLEAWWL